MFDNFLPKALFISLTIHTVLVCSGYFMQMPKSEEIKQRKGVEISVKSQPRKKTDMSERPVKPVQQLDLKNTSNRQGVVPIRMASAQQTLPSNFMYERKREQIRSNPAVLRQIAVAQIKSEKINNPAYAAYNEIVRSRIEAKVYENYQKMEAGSVYLTFIISSDGSLKAAQIIDEKSHGSANLKNTSMKSLQQSKFPPFMKGMTLPEYTFNIEIQFQVRD